MLASSLIMKLFESVRNKDRDNEFVEESENIHMDLDDILNRGQGHKDFTVLLLRELNRSPLHDDAFRMKCLRFFAENVNENGEFTNQQMLHTSKEGTGEPSSTVYSGTNDSSVFNRAFNAPIEHGNNANPDLMRYNATLTRVSPLDLRRSPTRKHSDRIEKENESFARDLLESNLRSPSKGPNVSGNVRNAKTPTRMTLQASVLKVSVVVLTIEESQKNKTSQKYAVRLCRKCSRIYGIVCRN